MMKIPAIVGTLVVAACAGFIYQDEFLVPGRDGRRREKEREPIFVLFDADDDGQLSAEEISRAVEILKARDTDGDGMLTRHELPRPPHGGRHRGGRPDDPARNESGDRGPCPSWDDEPIEEDLVEGTVVIRGGCETDRRDGGRPVALIAGALGVEASVFRDAFSNVQPSRVGPPSASRAQANKKVLMDALRKHGVTNERLDEVSNYYRYRPEAGESWPHKLAVATATVRDGVVTDISVVDGGSGYLSSPTVTIVGHESVQVEVELALDETFERNGRIASLTIVGDAAE